MASFAGVRFNYHILQKDYPVDSPQRKRAEEYSAHFDARAFNGKLTIQPPKLSLNYYLVPTQGEVYNNLLWRSSFDCRRNSVFSLARKYFSTKQLHKLGTTALIEKLKKEKNVDWEQQDAWFKYGTFVKKELFEKEGINPRKPDEVLKIIKSRAASKSFLLGPYNEENIATVFSKYWESPLIEALKLQEEQLGKKGKEEKPSGGEGEDNTED